MMMANHHFRNHDNDIDLAAFRRFAMLQRQNQVHAADAGLMAVQRFGAVRAPLRESRFERILVQDTVLSYNGQDGGKVGLYISAKPITRDKNYFEVEIIDAGVLGTIGVGLVPPHYPLDCQPGWNTDSIGYHADDGKLFKSNSTGRPFGPLCSNGDRIGCGVNFGQVVNDDPFRQMVPVFFTKNGKEALILSYDRSLFHTTLPAVTPPSRKRIKVGTVLTVMPPEGLNPAVGMHSEGEEVRLNLDARWDDVVLMSIDSCEEDWSRLHDIRVNGQLLEYVGRGKSIIDVGLAQARNPLTTRYHYFELQVVDPGENCYVAIGVARRDYPKHRHPGWNKGSVAYHADDGKIFVGSGVGEQFGPQCNKGDVMGCGILFPRDYRREWDEGSDDVRDGLAAGNISDVGANNDVEDGDGDNRGRGLFDSSESEDEEWWARPNAESGTKVQVFFTRNGKTVGRREVRIPKGGFYPTIGMLSSDEKVRVDLRPLTG